MEELWRSFGGVWRNLERYFGIFEILRNTMCKSLVNCGEHFGMLRVIQSTLSKSLVNYDISTLIFTWKQITFVSLKKYTP